MDDDRIRRLADSDYLYYLDEEPYERYHGTETLPVVRIEPDPGELVTLNAADLRELLAAIDAQEQDADMEEAERATRLSALDYGYPSGMRVGSEKDPYP